MKTKIILFFMLSFVSFKNVHAQIGQLKIGDTFNMSEIRTIDGELYQLDTIDNKVFVMNFWNIGCKGCELERPYLNELYHQYKDQDVIFWSITMNSNQILESFLEKHPVDWEVKGGIDFMGLEGDQTFLIKCMPMTILIDKERKVVYSQCGPILEEQSGDDFKNLIDVALD